MILFKSGSKSSECWFISIPRSKAWAWDNSRSNAWAWDWCNSLGGFLRWFDSPWAG